MWYPPCTTAAAVTTTPHHHHHPTGPPEDMGVGSNHQRNVNLVLPSILVFRVPKICMQPLVPPTPFSQWKHVLSTWSEPCFWSTIRILFHFWLYLFPPHFTTLPSHPNPCANTIRRSDMESVESAVFEGHKLSKVGPSGINLSSSLEQLREPIASLLLFPWGRTL